MHSLHSFLFLLWSVWDDEEEVAEDAEEPIDNEFETDSEGEDDE